MKVKGGPKKPLYFYVPWSLNVIAQPSKTVKKSSFGKKWASISQEQSTMFGTLVTLDTSEIKSMLKAQNVFFVNSTKLRGNQEGHFFAATLLNGDVVLVEIRFKQGIDACKLIVKTKNGEIGKWVQETVQGVLQKK